MTDIRKNKYAIVTAAVLALSVYLITGVLLVVSRQYNEINSENLKDAVRTLGGLTPAAVFTDESVMNDWVSHIKSNTPYRITLIRRNGQVIFDNEAVGIVIENHRNRPEFQSAITSGIGAARRKSATLGQEFIYAAYGVRDTQGEIAGILRISRQVPSFSARLLEATYPFLIVGFFLTAGIIIGIYIFSRRLSRSIESKQKAELDTKTSELAVKAEEAEGQDRRLKAILNSMFEGVIVLDVNLKITLINPKLSALFDFDPEKDAHKMSLLEFSRSAELDEAARQVLASGSPGELTIKRYISGNGQHLRVYIASLGADRGLVIIIGDISRQVRLENVRKDFAANVSHELRTPIQIIKGFAENIIYSTLDDKDEIRRFAQIIGKNARSMENITNDLLTLVRLEDGSIPHPPMEETPVAALAEEAIAAVEVAARKKNITIDVSCPIDLSAKLHRSFIIQALVNLIDNSIKYSDEGARVQINIFRKDDQLIIEVKDNGIGIPAKHIDHIFERFYRVDRARSREAGGSGLGLAIVRHIAQFHNGSVEAESHAGEGSLFRLRLPV
ncbi:MAG: ATP-binding protein [Treponema sp.]|nr:ATP-binding protein [Treponema sp.]